MIIHIFFYVLGLFLTFVFAKGSGTESDPFQQYVTPGNKAILQCKYEHSKLQWYKRINKGWSIISDGTDVINDTKYQVSVNPNTGMPYKLHVLNSQSGDELFYRCLSGIDKIYFVQLILYGEHFYGLFQIQIWEENYTY